MARSGALVFPFLSALLLIAWGARAADELLLTNGQKFSGEVEEWKGDALKFKTA
jgi:hypothetical protein